MKILRVDATHPEPEAVDFAASILRAGGLVAFPTETVYGLGGNALDPVALERIFAAKGRPAYNPLIAHCFDARGARSLAADWPSEATILGDAFWPGPLTLVLPKVPEVPDRLTAGLETVAIRVPSHPVARALLQAAQIPIAAPSANRFTELSPTTAEHVAKSLSDRIDLLLDGGPTSIGIESTVLDLTGAVPVLLRPGSITLEQIESALGRPIEVAGDVTGESARRSPGMIEKHYAPRARLLVVGGDEIGPMAAAMASQSGVLGALLLTAAHVAGVEHSVRMSGDPALYARTLYATLHQLDEAGCDVILVEGVPAGPEWAGVRDRLGRARGK